MNRAACVSWALLLAGCGGSPSTPSIEDLEPGQIGTFAGAGQRATDPVGGAPIELLEARFDSPMDVVVAPNGELYILDWNGHKVRVVRDGKVAFVVGTGTEGDACETTPDGESCPATAAQLNHPTDVTFDDSGGMLVAAWHNSKIKRVDLEQGLVSDVCGNGGRNFRGDGGPCREGDQDLVSFDLPSGVVRDPFGNLFISDQANMVVRRLGTDGIIDTVAGDCPLSMGFGCSRGRGYVGDGGPATGALLNNSIGQGTDPQGKIALGPDGSLYIADTGNHVVRKVSPGPDGVIGDGDPNEEIITTIAGTGEAGFSGDGGPANEAALQLPTDVEIGPDGSIFVADRGNHCVRRIDADGMISSVAGRCGSAGYDGDGGDAGAAHLDTPYGIGVDEQGLLYIADTLNHCIRVVLPSEAGG